MSTSDNGDADATSPGLPGELVRSVAERLKEENHDLRRYGYQLALVPEGPNAQAAAGAGAGTQRGHGEHTGDAAGDGAGDGGRDGTASETLRIPLADVADAEAAPAGADGHWSEVEVQKLPNHELRIRLRGYTEEGEDGNVHERRMAELVRELVREALL